jgi:hypothetical protein
VCDSCMATSVVEGVVRGGSRLGMPKSVIVGDGGRSSCIETSVIS